MVELLRPASGGFLRPFGRGSFIREFLLGNGPYGSPSIDPNVGAPRADVFPPYKMAIMEVSALDRATRAEQKRTSREKRLIEPNSIDMLVKRYLAHLRYKAQGCRLHSFITYFSDLQRLGWVEATGREESSAFQDNYPPIPTRGDYRRNTASSAAPDSIWANPLSAYCS